MRPAMSLNEGGNRRMAAGPSSSLLSTALASPLSMLSLSCTGLTLSSPLPFQQFPHYQSVLLCIRIPHAGPSFDTALPLASIPFCWKIGILSVVVSSSVNSFMYMNSSCVAARTFLMYVVPLVNDSEHWFLHVWWLLWFSIQGLLCWMWYPRPRYFVQICPAISNKRFRMGNFSGIVIRWIFISVCCFSAFTTSYWLVVFPLPTFDLICMSQWLIFFAVKILSVLLLDLLIARFCYGMKTGSFCGVLVFVDVKTAFM